jgi:hypothetical protein
MARAEADNNERDEGEERGRKDRLTASAEVLARFEMNPARPLHGNAGRRGRGEGREACEEPQSSPSEPCEVPVAVDSSSSLPLVSISTRISM